MPDDSTDIFLMFVTLLGPVAGESSTSVSGQLFAGFKPGYMFEVDSFTFAIGLEDTEDKSGDAALKSVDKLGAAYNSLKRRVDAMPGRSASAAGSSGSGPRFMPSQPRPGAFKAFREGNMGAPYPVSVQPVNITRPIDKSSPVLLQHCINTTSFERVSVVKRKAAGTSNAGEPYLRLDFVGALIQDVSWSNEEPIKEVMQVISRSVTVRYRPQLPDGSLGAALVGFWTSNPAEETEYPML